MKPKAIITGAASGLGKDMAILLAQNYQLVLVDRDQTGLNNLQQALPGHDTFVLDLCDSVALQTFCRHIQAHHGDLALLINNAGITHRSLASVTEPDVIERVMQVNFFAPVRLAHALLPLLSQNNGAVVNISSMAGWMPVTERAGYCASKAALHQYFETLRAETSLHIVNVYPSFLATAIEQNALGGNGQTAPQARTVVGKVQTSQWMATRICHAVQIRKPRVYGDRLTYFASVLYRLWPGAYFYLMKRNLKAKA